MPKTKAQKKQGRKLSEELEFLERVPTMHPHLITHFGIGHFLSLIAIAGGRALELERRDVSDRAARLFARYA